MADLKIRCIFSNATWNMPLMHITILPAIPFANEQIQYLLARMADECKHLRHWNTYYNGKLLRLS